MTQAIIQVKNMGNSLGFRLPSAIAKQLHLHANQQIKLTLESNRLIIAPVKESLSDKLARFDNECHGGEVMATTLPIKAPKMMENLHANFD